MQSNGVDMQNPPTQQAYGELQQAFEFYNEALFDGALPHCLITMQRRKNTYGHYSSERFVHRHDKSMTDEIAMNPSYFAICPMIEILQTLVHEMSHAWQFHFGSPGRRGYHNREWAEKLESIGLMPSNTGKPGGKTTGEKMSDYPIEGGRFLAATEQLLTQKFAISWLDRVLPMHHAMGGEGNNMALGELAEMLAIPQEGPQNKSNRVKYRCRSCGAQVWGKSNLFINCGGETCENQRFEPVE